MKEYEIKRAATRLIQKYGKRALPKAVEVARFYLGERDDANAKRWINIGYEVKHLLNIYSVNEILALEKEALETEEA
ncbi:MAG: hypothetical protein PQ612_01610 [Rickettsiales bacterium]|nr:hypothetical protein [Pseudomonadota bacterium]MDA0965387.1 hypothetical protein [Pseudomonadota bacterium]MDG4544315.1 hypothetical protein [Rickettsiales bacterium]MDG4544840.1 hypothetical protein [Rickettsiales bacterium]MDG4546962.1 hypothetical protein [Rickettsiales bacterium]